MANIWDSAANYSASPPSTTWPSGAGGGQGGSTGNPYYNGGAYGQSQDWFSSPIGENIRESNQQLAFQSWLQRNGVGQNTNRFNQWAYQTQFPRFQQAYGMATMDNPMLTIDQFLKTMPQQQQMLAEYNALSANARGESPSVWAPNARWIPR